MIFNIEFVFLGIKLLLNENRYIAGQIVEF